MLTQMPHLRTAEWECALLIFSVFLNVCTCVQVSEEEEARHPDQAGGSPLPSLSVSDDFPVVTS